MNVHLHPRPVTPTGRALPHRSPRRRAVRVLPLVLAGGLAMGAVGCSSDGTTTAGPATTSGPAVTAAPGSASTTSGTRSGTTGTTRGTTGTTRGTTPGTTRGGSTSSTRDPNVLTPPSIVVNATPGNEEYCGKVAGALQELTALALSAIGGSGNVDVEEILTKVKASYADLAETAPPAIKDDVEVISATLQDVRTPADLQKLDADAATTAAGERFTAWIKAECGFDPNAS